MYARPLAENGEPTTFGVSGKLWRDALIMYDRRSRSLWSQIDGVAKAGPLAGERLQKIPSQMTTWRAWREQHPETLVLVKPPLEASPYASYHDGASWVGLPWTRGGRDERLDSKDLVLGIDLADGKTVAVSIDKLGREKVVSGEIADSALVVVAANDRGSPNALAAQVFSRRLDDQLLDFAWQDERLVDQQTGSTWDASSGLAVAGRLEGKSLEAVAATPIYWATWVSFHPETVLW